MRIASNYLELGPRRACDRIELRCPLRVWSEEIAVGNPGHRQWRYRVTWKGDTLVRMEPLDNDVAACWSDFDKKDMQVFYGAQAPRPLYQREDMLREDRAHGYAAPARRRRTGFLVDQRPRQARQTLTRSARQRPQRKNLALQGRPGGRPRQPAGMPALQAVRRRWSLLPALRACAA